MEDSARSINFWDKRFETQWHHNRRASPSVVNVFRHYKEFLIRKKILDLGGAQGAHSIYALENEMSCAVSIDFSEVGTRQLNEWAKERGYEKRINAICEDLEDSLSKRDWSSWRREFGLVCALFVLYNFEDEIWKGLTYKMQESTEVGGFNLIAVPNTHMRKDRYFPKIFENSEIDSLYNRPIIGDWEIINEKDFPREMEGRWLGGRGKASILLYRRIE